MPVLTPSFDIKEGETKHYRASGYDSRTGQGHAFVHPPVVWEIPPGGENIIELAFDPGFETDHVQVNVTGLMIGSGVVKVTCDGVESDVTFNVVAPYDEILISPV